MELMKKIKFVIKFNNYIIHRFSKTKNAINRKKCHLYLGVLFTSHQVKAFNAFIKIIIMNTLRRFPEMFRWTIVQDISFIDLY